MIITRVFIKPNPVGSFTITLQGLNDEGRVVIGHAGGVPGREAGKAVTQVADLLAARQGHVSTVWNAKQGKAEVPTSG